MQQLDLVLAGKPPVAVHDEGNMFGYRPRLGQLDSPASKVPHQPAVGMDHGSGCFHGSGRWDTGKPPTPAPTTLVLHLPGDRSRGRKPTPPPHPSPHTPAAWEPGMRRVHCLLASPVEVQRHEEEASGELQQVTTEPVSHPQTAGQRRSRNEQPREAIKHYKTNII